MDNQKQPAFPMTTDIGVYFGMTKFEWVKLELLKAMLANPDTNNGHIKNDVEAAHIGAVEFFKD